MSSCPSASLCLVSLPQLPLSHAHADNSILYIVSLMQSHKHTHVNMKASTNTRMCYCLQSTKSASYTHIFSPPPLVFGLSFRHFFFSHAHTNDALLSLSWNFTF